MFRYAASTVAHIAVRCVSTSCAEGAIRVAASPHESVRSVTPNGLKVGLTHFKFEDPTRHRPLLTHVWYPAESTAIERDSNLDGIFVARFALNAPLASMPQKFPLVLVSHGSGGRGSNLVWLAEHVAKHSYIVAVVDHFGNTFGNNSSEGNVSVWQRPPISRA